MLKYHTGTNGVLHIHGSLLYRQYPKILELLSTPPDGDLCGQVTVGIL